MHTFSKLVCSSVGKKFLMALSGIALTGFLLTHLAGNLTLLVPGSETFNAYVVKLHSIGPVLLTVAELGLLFLFLAHIVLALNLKLGSLGARPVKYYGEQTKSANPPSPVILSKNMIVTGGIILIFLVLHVAYFRFGIGVPQEYTTVVDGHETRDLHRVVVEAFQNPFIVGFYVFVMLLLAGHLRHGFWSAFQSLGLTYPRYNCAIKCTGMFLATLLGIGFLILPVFIFFYY